MDYPTSLDEIDQWLFDSFGILPGCCSSIESVKHTTARMVAEALWPKAVEDLGWHSVDESLPPIDEEVIVLTDEMHGKKLPSACHISYGHRPNPDGWDGKSIFTGKVTHHDVITYDGWNIPGVRYWMPMPKLPKEEQK